MMERSGTSVGVKPLVLESHGTSPRGCYWCDRGESGDNSHAEACLQMLLESALMHCDNKKVYQKILSPIHSHRYRTRGTSYILLGSYSTVPSSESPLMASDPLVPSSDTAIPI